MKSYNLHRFSKPEFLRQIAPELLLAFLRRFPKCSATIRTNGLIDYELLALLLVSPQSGADTDLFDALALIDEMAAERNFDLLQEVVNDKPYSSTFGDNASVADLTLLLWLNEPLTLERLQVKFSRNAPKSFVYFHSERKRTFAPPTRHLLQRLSRLLNRIFQRRRRGRTVKITLMREADGYWFMVRKGEPMARDSAIAFNGKTECVFYRPERFDLAALRPKIAEIRLTIHRKAPWLVEAYRTLFGHVFYGDREYFSGTNIFTLEPLLRHGEAALRCQDVDGMETVTLFQCKFETPGGEVVAIHGEHAIEILRDVRPTFLRRGRLVSAKFRVKFFNAKMSRMVTIKHGNQAEFKFDDDGKSIEQWLTARGFKHERK